MIVVGGICNVLAKAAILFRFLLVILPDSQRETVPSLTPTAVATSLSVNPNSIRLFLIISLMSEIVIVSTSLNKY